MTGKYFDKIDHAELAMKYWDTSMKIDRVNTVLKKLKRDLRCYEKAIKEIEDRNDGQPKHWYIIQETELNQGGSL